MGIQDQERALLDNRLSGNAPAGTLSSRPADSRSFQNAAAVDQGQPSSLLFSCPMATANWNASEPWRGTAFRSDEIPDAHRIGASNSNGRHDEAPLRIHVTFLVFPRRCLLEFVDVDGRAVTKKRTKASLEYLRKKMADQGSSLVCTLGRFEVNVPICGVNNEDCARKVLALWSPMVGFVGVCCLQVEDAKQTNGKRRLVLQLFGLVNTLLENSRKTSEKDLSIQRYAVIPLASDNGLIGWVPNCDTLHDLRRNWRGRRCDRGFGGGLWWRGRREVGWMGWWSG
ncbi:hypothetical protein Droror1_Dr00013651 [Drosera rotundifolia]